MEIKKKKPSEMKLSEKLQNCGYLNRLERIRVCEFFGISQTSSLREIRKFCKENPTMLNAWETRNKSLDIMKIVSDTSIDQQAKTDRIEDEFGNLILIGIVDLKRKYQKQELTFEVYLESLNRLANLYKNLSIGKQGRARAVKITKPDHENLEKAPKIELNFGDTLKETADDDDYDTGEL